ncbi:hypothetical protein E2562_013395 [Oryza meyeriana var. granulata]|uniref:Uncharacterized protein n=1 Tax=Oryza meyeriana var. granulata TaxID=110450 RepID=A0A6G1CGL2_9ORYZ|nr:hypothetical protein E2562_013395 [Oryza meyeriana var. granulata]
MARSLILAPACSNQIRASSLGGDDLVQRSLLVAWSMGARADVINLRDDEVARLYGREGLFYIKYDIETGSVDPLYVPLRAKEMLIGIAQIV